MFFSCQQSASFHVSSPFKRSMIGKGVSTTVAVGSWPGPLQTSYFVWNSLSKHRRFLPSKATGQEDQEKKPKPRPISSISPTGATDFLQCPMLFKFRHIMRLKEPQSAELVRGIVIHDCLAKFYALTPAARTQRQLQKIFAETWSAVRIDERKYDRQPGRYKDMFPSENAETNWMAETLYTLSNALLLEDASSVVPLKCEERLEGVFPDGLKVVGVLDRLDKDDDGRLIIIDYKTGKPPMLKYSEATNRRIVEEKFFQLRIYALLIAKQYQEIPKELKLIYLQDPTKLTKPVDSATIGQTLQELQEIWQNIQNSIEKDSFDTNVCKFCDYCFHQKICPAFNSDKKVKSKRES